MFKRYERSLQSTRFLPYANQSFTSSVRCALPVGNAQRLSSISGTASIDYVYAFVPGGFKQPFWSAKKQDVGLREWHEAARQRETCVNLMWQLWSQRGSDGKSVWSKAPTCRLSGEKSVCVCSVKIAGGEMTAWKEALPISVEGRSSWWIKGLSVCKCGERSDEERGQRAKRCQVWSQLERRREPMELVTGRE